MDLAFKFFKASEKPYKTLESLYFEHGYTLTVTEAAAALDVKERYLMDTFSDKFDFVLVPARATQCFTDKIDECFEQLKSKNLKANERIAIEKNLNRYRFLTKKRVFINYDSFISFLTKNLYRDSNSIAIRLTNEEKQKLSQAQLNEVVERVLERFEFEDVERRLVTEREAFSLLRNPVLSGASVKVEYLKREYSHYLRRTVHDMQLHRFLNRLYSNQRFTIQGLGDEREVVRYRVEFDKADDEIDASFLIPYCDSKLKQTVKKAVIKEIAIYRKELEKQRAEERKLKQKAKRESSKQAG